MVQGITGREGQARTRLMRGYGTNIVAGCTPGKGGQNVEGVPVHDHVAQASSPRRSRPSRPACARCCSSPIACPCGTRWRLRRRREPTMPGSSGPTRWGC
ncbi:MAG: hypothetical protein ACYTGC_19845 [Planctomycetota bacterium]